MAEDESLEDETPEVPEDEALDWDLQERDRWMDEHDDGSLPDPALTIVESEE